MRTKTLLKTLLLIAFILIAGFQSQALAERATTDEALTVADNWISLITQKKGHWAGSQTARVEKIQELKRGQRVIGYFCSVKPAGYIVISLHKELTPVKAYSAVSSLNPDSDEGLADLIKGGMERVIDGIEKKVGKIDSARAEDIDKVLQINHRRSWQELGVDTVSFQSELGSGILAVGYQESEVLLSSAWHQREPYNIYCPQIFGEEYCDNALVGCVPLAGAQIMNYWKWPPYGAGAFSYSDPYDWPNMADEITGSSPQVEIDAVAELCAEAGDAADVGYGCSETSGYLSCWWWGCRSMEDAFKENFTYMDDASEDHYDDSVAWFEKMKAEFNKRRPIAYRIPGHVVVADGWQEIGSTPSRYYHINYGWANYENFGWYALDGIVGGDPSEEYMLVNLRPYDSLGAALAGSYPLQTFFPYRYFNEDATGASAEFGAGQYLQFLPGVTVTGSGTIGDAILIRGSGSAPTRLFTNGDISRGLVISGGAMKLANNGSISLAPLGRPKYLKASVNTELNHVALVWEDSYGDQDGVLVERSTGAPGFWTLIGNSAKTETFYRDETIQSQTAYFYRVRSFGGGQLSDYTKSVSVYIPQF